MTQPQKPEGRGGFGLDSSSFMCDLLPKPPAAAEAPPDQSKGMRLDEKREILDAFLVLI